MAYQNVGTPRFFIDNYQYLRAIGLDPQSYIDETSDDNTELPSNVFKTPLHNPELFTLSPENSKELFRELDAMRFFVPCGEFVRGMDFSGNMKWYGALLNHNLGDANCRIQNTMFMKAISSEDSIADNEEIGILNHETTSNMNNGSSIWYSDLVPTDERFTGFRITGDDGGDLSNFQAGAISMGVIYTMPNSPDLDLKMEIEFDGYDSVTTIGGSDLTNIRHTGAPVWTNDGKFINPFGVGDYASEQSLGGAKRNGRRSWSLKFSYISDTDLFASNYMSGNYNETPTDYDSGDLDYENQFEYNMFTDDSFVAQVWNKTLGGALPFIFQPDSTNNNPDQFCIAKFDMDSLNISQKAFKAYNVSVKIREVW